MVTIGDLVKVDERAEFRNDVQLDDFNDKSRNLGLINSYLFSSALPGGSQQTQSPYTSPVGMLENLVQAFTSTRLENRFSLIATYGHGKSHLALALANYFSQPADSEEMQTLLRKLSNAVEDKAKVSRYTDFKQARGEFLVIRLRGDVAHNLHEQVLRGLERALQEHSATCNEKLPFWFTEARKIINQFTPEEKENGNSYLESAGYDLSVLLERLTEDVNAHDLCVKLIHYVKGVRPNLGGEVSLADVVHWVTDELCGEGKPLGGLLLLFDEFTLYVQKYAQRSATGELQDLLNGVSDRQGKAVFLAFSQIDPNQLADNLHMAHEARNSLKHELTRIPKKWVLFSLMESVVDAYLVQDERHWHLLMTDKKTAGPFTQATDVAWERFKKRYSTTLNWTFEQFQERVTKGAFPLHPITTHLLCNMRLQSDDTSVPRTVLGFVLEQLRLLRDEPAIQSNNRPNWILPIALIDYFSGRLSGDIYAQYENARRTIGNDAPAEQQAVLKGLLLQYLADITARHDEQLDFIAQAAGVTEREAQQALRTLSDNKVIRFERTYRNYDFWPASTQPKVLEDTIQKKLVGFQWSAESGAELNKFLSDLIGKNFGLLDVNVTWGHPTDWAAQELVVTPDMLTDKWLRKTSGRYSYENGKLIEPSRGTILWIVAHHEDEIQPLRGTIVNLFQTAFADCLNTPPVVVAVIPTRPHPELFDAYRRKWALTQFTQAERNEAGQEMYDAELQQAKATLLLNSQKIRLVDSARSSASYMVPTAYIEAVRGRSEILPRQLLEDLYRRAYAYAPNEFFRQYQLQKARKLKSIIGDMAQPLMTNRPAEIKIKARDDSTTGDLCNKYLVQKWEVLTPDYRIKEQPGNWRVREAWKHIDSAVQVGQAEIQLRTILFPLLNPPFGYDYNTALLMFMVWFGYYKPGLEVLINGRRSEHQTLIDLIKKKGAQEFFKAITGTDLVALRRRAIPDAGKIKARLQEIPELQFTLVTANEEIISLHEIAADELYDGFTRVKVKQMIEFLEEGLTLAQEYDQKAAELKNEIAKAKTITELNSLQKKIAGLPQFRTVQPMQDPPTRLREQIEARFAEVVETVCRENESPTDLTEVGLKRQNLASERKAVAQAGLPALTQRIDESLARLKSREAELEQKLKQQEREKNIQATIVRIDAKGTLKQLLIGLETLKGFNNLSENLAGQRDNRLQQVEVAIANIHDHIAKNRTKLEQVNQISQIDELQSVREKLLQLKERCIDTAEEKELETLLEQCTAKTAELTAQAQRHTQLKQTILRVTGTSPLSELVAGIAELNQLDDLPDDLRPLRDNQLRTLEEAINNIHDEIAQRQGAINTATKPDQLEKLRKPLFALQIRCAETAQADEVEHLLALLESKREQLLQSERQADEIRQLIDNAKPQGKSLNQLDDAHRQLLALTNIPPDLISNRDQRLNDIATEINTIRNQIIQVSADLQATRDSRIINNHFSTLASLQSRCVGTPEEGEITALLAQAEALKAELEEEKRRMDEWRTIINNAASVKSSRPRLRQLLDDQSTLQALPALPDTLERQRTTRLQEIEQAIVKIEQQIADGGDALDSVTDERKLQKQRHELRELQHRCEETRAESLIIQHLERADRLDAFFIRLAEERSRSARSVADTQTQLKRLEQLGQEYPLTAEQQTLITREQERIKQAVKTERDSALRWLSAQEKSFNEKHNPVKLQEQLKHPPTAFQFSVAADQQRLEKLREQLQQRIDADALTAIENRFRQIQDRSLQEECLRTLQQILEAESS